MIEELYFIKDEKDNCNDISHDNSFKDNSFHESIILSKDDNLDL